MMEIPETGLRRYPKLGMIGRKMLCVGMMGIPETGLRLQPPASAQTHGELVGIMEIPETGLRLRDVVPHELLHRQIVGMTEIPENGIETAYLPDTLKGCP